MRSPFAAARSTLTTLTATLFALVCTPRAHAADRVVLADGTVLTGRIVFDTPEKLVVLQGTKERELAPAGVTEVRSVERALREVLDRWLRAPENGAKAWLEIARFARDSELEGEARLLAFAAAAVDPTLDAAHEFLGHEKRGGVWQVHEDKRTYAFTDADRAHAEWKDGWRVSTLHWSLRTNAPFDGALRMALELELLYRAFFERFRAELGLRDVVEVMRAQAHFDAASFPGGDVRRGFFDVQLNTFFQDVSSGFDPRTTAHEGTHALLWNTATKTRAALGALPAWIDEGLADTIAMSRSGPPGRAKYAPRARDSFYFQLHATAKKPYDLPRVLTLGTEDFSISSHVGLAYAQSYTLVQYCLEGAERKYRAGFFEFLRRCYAGKPSMTSFKDALGITREAEFEAAWHAYAKRGP